MKQEKEVSDCCHEELLTDCADEGTCCYICKKCGKPCDPVKLSTMTFEVVEPKLKKTYDEMMKGELQENGGSEKVEPKLEEESWQDWMGELKVRLGNGEPMDYFEAVDFIRQVRLQAIEEYRGELVKEIEKLKIPADKMKHNLRGNCDFERNLTLIKVLEIINNKKI